MEERMSRREGSFLSNPSDESKMRMKVIGRSLVTWTREEFSGVMEEKAG